MRSEILLIGPFGAGKSTIGRLLAEHLNLPDVSMDSHKEWYAELGWNPVEFKRIWNEQSPHAADRYFHAFFPDAVERLLTTYHDCVFDLGAGHTVFEDEILFERVRQSLQSFKNVVLVLPTPDLNESVRILCERETLRNIGPYFLNSTEFDYFSHWVKSHCNLDLANFTIYTEGKTPEQSRDEVLALVANSQ